MRKTIQIAVLLSATVMTTGQAQVIRRAEIAYPERYELESRLHARGGIGSVESVLRQRERLALTEAQVAQLETIRKEEVTRRQNASRDAIELESRIAAGLETRESTREQMQERLEAIRTQQDQLRERIEKILTDEQKQKLEERVVRARSIGFVPGFAPMRVGALPVVPGMRGRIAPFPRGELGRIAPLLPDEFRGRFIPGVDSELRVFPGARVPGLVPRLRMIPRDRDEPIRYKRRGVI